MLFLLLVYIYYLLHILSDLLIINEVISYNLSSFRKCCWISVNFEQELNLRYNE